MFMARLAGGLGKSFMSTAATTFSGRAGSAMARWGMESAYQDQIDINNTKARLNFLKISSLTAAATSAEAARTAGQ